MSGLLVYPIFWLLWRPPHKFLVFVVFFLPSYNLGSSQGYPRPNTFGPGVANIQNFYCLTQDLPVMKQHQMKSQRYSMICKLGEVEGEHICASCFFLISCEGQILQLHQLSHLTYYDCMRTLMKIFTCIQITYKLGWEPIGLVLFIKLSYDKCSCKTCWFCE